MNRLRPDGATGSSGPVERIARALLPRDDQPGKIGRRVLCLFLIAAALLIPTAQEPGPRVVQLPAGGTAVFRMHWGQVPVGNETSCPVSARMAIIPPDEYAPLLVDVAARACGGGRLNVGAVQPLG